jgi:hypothetical protein
LLRHGDLVDVTAIDGLHDVAPPRHRQHSRRQVDVTPVEPHNNSP